MSLYGMQKFLYHLNREPRVQQRFRDDQAALLADLQELHDLLRNSDMQALDVHARLQAVHGGGAAGELEALDAALAAFDFVQGALACDDLIRKLRVQATGPDAALHN